MSKDVLQLAEYALVLEALHKLWSPHSVQIAPGRALFAEGCKKIFVNFGRRTGKSSLIAYIAVRWALTRPNSACYILAPLLRQARELYWHSGVLTRVVPKEFVEAINVTEGRITFSNGSFVRVIGADDPDSIRGIRASLIALDEIKDIKQEIIDVIGPTLIDEDGPLVMAGTPPEVAEHPFWEMVNVAKNDPDWKYFHGTTYDNPYLKKEVIDRERAKLQARGDEDIFIREYLAEFAPGGRRSVFPMLSEADHVAPYNKLLGIIYKNPSHWQYYVALDPGTASCFAGLIGVVNPYSSQVMFLDEVYATHQAENTVGKVWPLVANKMKAVHDPDRGDDDQWLVIVDEAATWARQEILDRFHVPSIPTQKKQNDKAEGIGLMKDLLISKRLIVSDRCVNLLKEMKGYMLDRNGRYIKKADHLCDCSRYLLGGAFFSYNESEPPQRIIIPPDEQRQAFTPQQDYEAFFGIEHEPYSSDQFSEDDIY